MKDQIKTIVKENVDILFFNENEARRFTSKDSSEALKQFQGLVSIAVLKQGERGSMIMQNGKIETIAPRKVKCIDSTGAGDTYAAGFLYGYCSGWDNNKSGQLASSLASKIVQNIGVNFENLEKEMFL